MPPERTNKTEGEASRKRGNPLLAIVVAAFAVLMSAVEVNHSEVAALSGSRFISQSAVTPIVHTWVKRGWPITYRVDERWLWPKRTLGLPLYVRSTLSAEGRRWSFVALAANYLTFLAIFGVAAFLLGACYRRQFTLRSLFGVIFCTAVILSALNTAPILSLSESQRPPALSEFR